MKTLIVFLFIPFLSLAADVVPQHIDDAFSYRYEEEKQESKRAIANDKQVQPSEKEVEVVDESDRDLASQEDKSSEDIQKHAKKIKYWKY